MQNTLWTKLKKLLTKPKPVVVLEPKMSTKIVKFDVRDGRKPRKLEGVPGKPFGLLAPINVSCPPRTTFSLKLGISCPYPCFVVTATGSELFAPGAELTAKFNTLEEGIDFSEGETIARAYLIVNSDLVLE